MLEKAYILSVKGVNAESDRRSAGEDGRECEGRARNTARSVDREGKPGRRQAGTLQHVLGHLEVNRKISAQ
jgi:hypothetical protein